MISWFYKKNKSCHDAISKPMEQLMLKIQRNWLNKMQILTGDSPGSSDLIFFFKFCYILNENFLCLMFGYFQLLKLTMVHHVQEV